ncbi:L-threonine synthase [Desulfonispora thiosulfatigenes DSM 11270]|uniref:Threonine synthase n=1 Tax=Desulfonispora thiosulfatigenes DSM 11270 TaxID=656914 RepID=A0A1W1VTI8_DESTI|nr:threonine synthase [Desulfonispora thiosulfatigenes]SMB96550.1 L-threonine synthase [Desulfonispora thiosulfatigenes DSM 11270]
MYISTRSNYNKVTAAEAIKLGMVPTGGLFVPENIPVLSAEKIKNFKDKSYNDIAQEIFSLYLHDYTQSEIKECVSKAYNTTNFDDVSFTPLVKLNDHTYIMELWHGPTAAFKDMALQILPHFLSLAIKKTGVENEVVILVATSGDTGKAALEGFKDVPGIRIITFYPYKGVSKIQELQMNTTEGENTYVVGVHGNFDDCQTTVKEIFSNEEFKQMLLENGIELSSANSINWGRLLPQIIYYFASYSELLKKGDIKEGEKVNFVVPTGNFGNILAGWYAHKMGLPVNKFICASNENKVLTDFFQTGKYDKRREFKKTNSPSMDILVSSNLERFLYEITDHDGDKINNWMNDLNNQGYFEVDEDTKRKIQQIMYGNFTNEEQTKNVIKETFENYKYTLDTHTAVALKVYDNYIKETKDKSKTIIDSTASPFKFNEAVLEALTNKTRINQSEYESLDQLSKISGLNLHFGLKDLDKKPILHKKVCKKEEIPSIIKDILNIK